MGIFETMVLPTICVFGVVGALWYGVRTLRLREIAEIRASAFDEARAALQSLANIAGDAAAENQRTRGTYGAAADRAYYYQRAANIVASIPASR